MKDRTQMTRICSACGTEKPLAAFLEISSTHGTRYGTICATCRGAGITEKKHNNNEDDKSTIATTGTRIGLKERVFIENQQKKQITISKDEHREQINKRETLKQEKQEKSDTKEKSERDHRHNFLDAKRQPGFLGKKLPMGTIAGTPPPGATSTFAPEKANQDKIALDTKQQQDATRQDTKNKTFNLVDQYVDAQAGETRAHSATFLAFQDSLEVTPFKIARERLKKLTTSSPAAEGTKPTDTKDPLLDFVEKNWSGPSSTRRR